MSICPETSNEADSTMRHFPDGCAGQAILHDGPSRAG
jgi:hypothetical protein